MLFTHDLHLSHTRHPITQLMGVPDASSSISIAADSNSLVEACSELISRLPPDVYAALREAMIRSLKAPDEG